MGKTRRNERTATTLPAEIRQLIVRKVDLLRQEQVERFLVATKMCHSELTKQVEGLIRTTKVGQLFIRVPLAAYADRVVTATAITRSWPRIVWGAIKSTLDRVRVVPSAHEIHSLMDELTWDEDHPPSTLDFVNPDRFKESFDRLISAYRSIHDDFRKSFNDQLRMASSLATVGILNTGRREREVIAIEIEEYVIEGRLNRANSVQAGITDDPHAMSGGAASSHSDERSLTVNDIESTGTNKSSPEVPIAKQCEVFRNMRNLSADELRIRFVGDKTEFDLGPNNILEVSARNEIRRVGLIELGLVDRRDQSLNKLGKILLDISQKRNILYTPTNQQNIHRLRNVIRSNFRIRDSFDVLPNKGWRPRFQIEDARGLADERAKQNAGRHTISLTQRNSIASAPLRINDTEYTFESENDDADKWLKGNLIDLSK